ncbi:hypothetical protein L1049_003667 [Liquidambar formosana]|uniref:Uncharacterized protein n=1 Tax=Liquidambar formosana TaxID=63359 RepID=A0AAP0WZU6_LIQFO
MFRARNGWVRASKRVPFIQPRRLSTNNIKPTNKNGNDKAGEASAGELDAYRQLDKLDFMTAAKILFTTPPKKKKFGIDFHLVQFFFACLPSLAVYLVAKYARYEIRRMEAEVELKKKAEEEKKAKEMETSAAEKEMGSDPELLQVKMRLEKLEETVKEIAVESKKQSDSSKTKNQGNGLASIEPSNAQSRSETSKTATSDHIGKQEPMEETPGLGQVGVSGSAQGTDVSQQDQKGKTQTSQDAKK